MCVVIQGNSICFDAGIRDWPVCSLLRCCKNTLEKNLLDLLFELGWGQKSFKTASWRPPGAIFELGARNASKRPPGDLLKLLFGLAPEMLQNGLLETSVAGARNASTRPPGDLLELLLSLGPEMFQNGFLETSWAYFWAWRQKCFKTASWKPSGSAFGSRARNACKTASWKAPGAQRQFPWQGSCF